MGRDRSAKALTPDTTHARFLGCADRLGGIENGKLADLVLIAGNPLADIRARYNVKRVMLNGSWIPE
jgi:imidazolonepropionase-like amidohydrolase